MTDDPADGGMEAVQEQFRVGPGKEGEMDASELLAAIDALQRDLRIANERIKYLEAQITPTLTL